MLRLGNGGASSSPLVSRTSQVVGYGVEEYEQTVLYDVVDGVVSQRRIAGASDSRTPQIVIEGSGGHIMTSLPSSSPTWLGQPSTR
jgi:hypothetical protein